MWKRARWKRRVSGRGWAGGLGLRGKPMSDSPAIAEHPPGPTPAPRDSGAPPQWGTALQRGLDRGDWIALQRWRGGWWHRDASGDWIEWHSWRGGWWYRDASGEWQPWQDPGRVQVQDDMPASASTFVALPSWAVGIGHGPTRPGSARSRAVLSGLRPSSAMAVWPGRPRDCADFSSRAEKSMSESSGDSSRAREVVGGATAGATGPPTILSMNSNY